MKFQVGKRYIVKRKHCWETSMIEVKVMEISPSQEFIKFEYQSGRKDWECITDWEIVEKLSDEKISD